MITLIFTILAVLLVVFQTSVVPLLPAGMGRPDLVYLLIAFCAYRCAWLPGIVAAFTAGWFLDVLVGFNLGVYPLEYLSVFCTLKLLSTNSPVKESAYQIPLVGVSYFLVQIAIYFLFLLAAPDAPIDWSWASVIKGTVLLVIAAFPCFLLLNKLYDYLEKRARSSQSARRRIVRKN